MYKGEMFSANLEKNRITIEVEGEMKVKAGKLVVLSDNEYATLQAELKKANQLIETISSWLHQGDESNHDSETIMDLVNEHLEAK